MLPSIPDRPYCEARPAARFFRRGQARLAAKRYVRLKRYEQEQQEEKAKSFLFVLPLLKWQHNEHNQAYQNHPLFRQFL